MSAIVRLANGNAQLAWPSNSLCVPTAQSRHTVALGADQRPAGHGAHSEELCRAANVPAVHTAQGSSEPVVARAEPGSQRVHDGEPGLSWKRPVAQGTQAESRLLSGEDEPAGHGRQRCVPGSLYSPAAQPEILTTTAAVAKRLVPSASTIVAVKLTA